MKYKICLLIGLHKIVIAAFLLAASNFPVYSQSQALNGQIEGTVIDQDMGAVAGATVTALNVETGASRTVISGESGVYRIPLLPLGAYRIAVQAANFKKLVREGVTLSAGQTATIDVTLTVGEVAETVNVSSDTSIADAGKIVIASVMDTHEVQNLPLISRNPLNYAVLQSNVTGRPNRGYLISNVHVNGYLRRVNYQLDGNGNTAYDRRIRFALVSETYVSEIQLVTNGFAAEFGHTPGMIMNVITPSGTNNLKGAVSYRFRRPAFYSRPFFYPSAGDVPDNRSDVFTGAVGGPVVKDRWHFYFGYERGIRDDEASASRLSTILPGDRDQLIAAGLPASIFPSAIPSRENGSFYILRTDAQISERNRLTVRYNHSDLIVQGGGGGRNTLERSSNIFQADHSVAAQLTSYTNSLLNEFRFQYGRQHFDSVHNKFTGRGVSVNITRVANLGPPFGLDTVSPASSVIEFQNNLTRTTGAHVIKVGGGMSFHSYFQRAGLQSLYTFPSITAYINARNGMPDQYTNYRETFGDPEINTKTAFLNLFAQSDWKATRRLKFSYGLRYDLYRIPKADPTSPFTLSQNFRVDKNDLSPRFGVVYALREGNRPTVIRAGAGIYYDAPFLGVYRDVIHINGNPRFVNLRFIRGQPGAPQFPNNIGSLPPGTTLPKQDIYTIAPDYETSYAIQTNIQLEQALGKDLSFAVGFVHAGGRHINVYRNINPTNIIRYLADGRPVFGTDRLDPRFEAVVIAESTGVTQYDALALQLTQRLSRGIQFRANYTLSRAINDTPDGDLEGLFLSDPTNRSIDKGYSSADQRHTFVMSLVARPRFNLGNKWLRNILSNNQIGITANTNSGERFNIRALGPGNDGDLNQDGFPGSDRPAGVARNSGKTPPQFNLDLRYSRFISLSERYNLEAFAEFTNVFNINRIVSFTDITVPTNSNGELIGTLPDFRARNSSIAQDSRQVQLGFKFIF